MSNLKVAQEFSVLQVRKPRRLIEARYAFPPNRQKLLMLCVASVSPDATSFPDVITLDVDQVCSFLNINNSSKSHNNRALVKSVAVGLITNIEMHDPDSNKFVSIALVHKVVQEKNRLDLYFHPDLAKDLLALSRNIDYIEYSLGHAMRLNSSTAMRIFDILVLAINEGEIELEIRTLRKQLDLKSKYLKFSHFKQLVLNRAVKKINSKTPIKTYFEVSRKIGRTVTHVRFFIQVEKANQTLPLLSHRTEEKIKRLIRENEQTQKVKFDDLVKNPSLQDSDESKLINEASEVPSNKALIDAHLSASSELIKIGFSPTRVPKLIQDTMERHNLDTESVHIMIAGNIDYSKLRCKKTDNEGLQRYVASALKDDYAGKKIDYKWKLSSADKNKQKKETLEDKVNYKWKLLLSELEKFPSGKTEEYLAKTMRLASKELVYPGALVYSSLDSLKKCDDPRLKSWLLQGWSQYREELYAE